MQASSLISCDHTPHPSIETCIQLLGQRSNRHTGQESSSWVLTYRGSSVRHKAQSKGRMGACPGPPSGGPLFSTETQTAVESGGQGEMPAPLPSRA